MIFSRGVVYYKRRYIRGCKFLVSSSNEGVNMVGQNKSNKSVLDMSNVEAKKFFLKNKCYSNLDLPSYFNFEPMLWDLDDVYGDTLLNGICKADPKYTENNNYTLFTNKDGNFAWRPIQLIHPLLYLDLVNTLTNGTNWEYIKSRFKRSRILMFAI